MAFEKGNDRDHEYEKAAFASHHQQRPAAFESGEINWSRHTVDNAR